jgi:hypothetical protein
MMKMYCVFLVSVSLSVASAAPWGKPPKKRQILKLKGHAGQSRGGSTIPILHQRKESVSISEVEEQHVDSTWQSVGYHIKAIADKVPFPNELLNQAAQSSVHMGQYVSKTVSTVDLGHVYSQAVNSSLGNGLKAISTMTSNLLQQAANSTAVQYVKSIPKEKYNRAMLWTFPMWVAIISFAGFPLVADIFHELVQWGSAGTWYRKTEEQITLQANVVTQVVNGPVITSISVLFATLVSLTISNLYSRQVDIQKSFLLEVQNIRRLQQLLETTPAVLKRAPPAKEYLRQHSDNLLRESRGDLTTFSGDDNPHVFIESTLPALLSWSHLAISKLSTEASRDSQYVLMQIQDMTYSLLQERARRWLALEAMHFPAVHYLTLSLLALSIGISFLVATDQAGFIFLYGLPVKILWSVLAGSLAALGVLCFDLSRPFGGAYHVPDQE